MTYNLLRIPKKIGHTMYESLVTEYLSYELPPLVERASILGELPEPRQRNLITTLIGVRRCGKTFYLFQTMTELLRRGVPRDRMLYFAFDDDRLGDLDGLTASRVLDAYYALVPDAADGCYLFFDEIQDVSNWAAFARRVSERYNVTMVLTGSSSKLLASDIPTKLRGRSLSHEVWPLSFGEFCRFSDVGAGREDGACEPREAALLARVFRRYLDVGGFPAVHAMDDTTRARVLQAYAHEIMTKDVLERFGSASYRAGRRLALTVLRSTGLPFSVNKQVKAMRSAGISISGESAYSLLDDFEDAHLAFKVAYYSLSVRDNPRSVYKIYAVDQGLSLAVAPANHVDLGQRLETAVYVELKRRHGTDRERVIARYRSASCPEVDFVVGDAMLDAEYELIQVAVESGGPARRRPGRRRLREVPQRGGQPRPRDGRDGPFVLDARHAGGGGRRGGRVRDGSRCPGVEVVPGVDEGAWGGTGRPGATSRPRASVHKWRHNALSIRIRAERVH